MKQESVSLSTQTFHRLFPYDAPPPLSAQLCCTFWSQQFSTPSRVLWLVIWVTWLQVMWPALASQSKVFSSHRQSSVVLTQHHITHGSEHRSDGKNCQSFNRSSRGHRSVMSSLCSLQQWLEDPPGGLKACLLWAMSAIVALCHFCEVHGPSVIMVTQQTFCKTLKDGTSDNTGLLNRENFNHKSMGCERCWSLKTNDNLILSNDNSSHQTFVSSQAVLNRELEQCLRNAVIRAISCEVSVKREGPILFSDPSVSTVFANNFFLKDSKARGFQRYYSILIMSRERQYLIANLDIIENKVSKIIESIKFMSRKTFEKEADGAKDISKSKDGRRRSMAALRNLREIVGDPNIYQTVHKQFVVLLQSIEKVLKEKVLGGQVMKSSVTFPKASLSTIIEMKNKLGAQHFRILLHHILSGLTLQVKSARRCLSRKIGDSLCMFLPNNLALNANYFANLILTHGDLHGDIDLLPSAAQLEILDNLDPTQPESLSYQLTSGRCDCFDSFGTVFASCKYCKSLSESSVITKYCKLLKRCDIPRVVTEMSLRTFCESILIQARVYSKLTQTQRGDFLLQNNYTAIDVEIFKFYKYFSWHS